MATTKRRTRRSKLIEAETCKRLGMTKMPGEESTWRILAATSVVRVKVAHFILADTMVSFGGIELPSIRTERQLKQLLAKLDGR